MRTSIITLCLLQCLLCAGCAHRFTGNFEFKNSSTTQIWAEVTGLEYPPPAGALIPGARKTAHMYPMRLPSEVTLLWIEGARYAPRADEQSHTNISLTALPRYPGSGRLIFEFTSDRFWRVMYEPR